VSTLIAVDIALVDRLVEYLRRQNEDEEAQALFMELFPALVGGPRVVFTEVVSFQSDTPDEAIQKFREEWNKTFPAAEAVLAGAKAPYPGTGAYPALELRLELERFGAKFVTWDGDTLTMTAEDPLVVYTWLGNRELPCELIVDKT
jgi:hypothetical protein